jgi:hypothetical protein
LTVQLGSSALLGSLLIASLAHITLINLKLHAKSVPLGTTARRLLSLPSNVQMDTINIERVRKNAIYAFQVPIALTRQSYSLATHSNTAQLAHTCPWIARLAIHALKGQPHSLASALRERIALHLLLEGALAAQLTSVAMIRPEPQRCQQATTPLSLTTSSMSAQVDIRA